MKFLIPLSFILFGVVSCSQENKSAAPSPIALNDSKPTAIPVKSLNETEVPEEFLTLEADLNDNVERLEKNKFGSFLCDRAWFYVIDDPQNELYDVSPSSIVISYLDDELRQTKYIMDEDISDILIKELGNFKIKGRDSTNLHIIKNEPLLKKENGRVWLNHRLDRYSLRWVLGEKEIFYRVNKKLEEEKFVYYERDKDFVGDIRRLSRNCKKVLNSSIDIDL